MTDRIRVSVPGKERNDTNQHGITIDRLYDGENPIHIKTYSNIEFIYLCSVLIESRNNDA